MILGLIVEGHGEVEAAPVLLRRVVSWIAPEATVEIGRPWRVKRNQIVKEGELERVIQVLGNTVGVDGAVLVLLDADDDGPAALGPSLLQRARNTRPQGGVAVVLAKREFESWFLAGLTSLYGYRSLTVGVDAPQDPEHLRGAKEWLAARMRTGYSETLDQAAFAARVDLPAARRAGSFDKLVREVALLLRVLPPPRDS